MNARRVKMERADALLVGRVTSSRASDRTKPGQQSDAQHASARRRLLSDLEARGHAGRVSSSVWLITGAQASGKSTVADLLSQRFRRAVHNRGGQFYRWAVRGWVHVADDDQAEARRLLELRYRLSALVADEYAGAGFTAIVQDNIYGVDVARWLDRIQTRPVHLVVLRPSVEVVERRHEERRQRSGKIAYRGAYTAALNDRDLATTSDDLGLWLDTSEQEPADTVEEIVTRSTDAVVR